MHDVAIDMHPGTFVSGWDEIAWIERAISASFPADRQLSVLEAGCGRAWTLDLGGREYRLTGVDLNDEALDHRVKVVGDLHVPVLGDLRTAQLPSESFDLAYCAYVLEHVSGTTKVLENLDRWTAPGGLIVLRVPDRGSVYGAVARLSPYRTHVWYYRYVHRIPNAGKEGRAPFPTVYEPEVAPQALRAFFQARGYTIVGEATCEPFAGKQSRIWAAIRRLMRGVGRLTFGRLSGGHNNYALIVRKPASA